MEEKIKSQINLGALVDRAVKKSWSDADVAKYVGSYEYAALTYAADESNRRMAASGGTISALLIHGIDAGMLDGAVVCRTVLESGRVRARFAIARTPGEIREAQGSKYVEVAFLKEVLPLIRAFSGRLAVIGLPCDITAVKRWALRDPEVGEKLALTVALVCGHNSRKELIDHVTGQIERETGKTLSDYRFRQGHWRGKISATFSDGSAEQYPTGRFNDYQNLFFFCEKKCLACHDHYGYDADISVGDVWLFRLKRDAIKRSGLIVRTESADALVSSAVEAKAIVYEQLDIRDIMDGQSRIGPAHYNVSARARASKRFGIKLKDTVNERVRWFHYLNAWMSIANMRMSESRLGQKVVFLIPRRLIKIYLYFKKALETMR